MKARQLLARSAFDAAQLKSMKQAFDDAWDHLAPNVSARAEAVNAARYKLAQVVLSVAKRGIVEREELKDEALRLMHAPPTAVK